MSVGDDSQDSLYDRMMKAYNAFRTVGTVGGGSRLGTALGALIPSVSDLGRGLDPTQLGDRRTVVPRQAARGLEARDVVAARLPPAAAAPPGRVPPAVALEATARMLKDFVPRSEETTAARAAPPDLPLPRTPAVVAAPVYAHAPDPWSRSIEPVGPGFARPHSPREPGTDENPRWHEGTPAYEAQMQQFVNRGQMAGTPTTRRQAMAAAPGSPLETALREYYKEPADFPGRSAPTPAGPGTATIATLRGNEPGQLAFYSPRQQAEMRSRGIDVGGPLPVEWNQGNLLALQRHGEQGAQAALARAKVGAEATMAAAEMKRAETGAKGLELAREEGHPERLSKKIQADLQADPTLQFNDAWRQSVGLPKMTAEQRLQNASKEEAPDYTYEQIQKADLTPQILLSDPRMRPQTMRKIQAIEKGFDPDAFWTRRFPPSEAKTTRQKAEYAFSQIADPARRASYRDLYDEYQKMLKTGPPSSP